MNPWQLRVLLTLVSLLAAQALQARTQPEDCKNLMIQVHDSAGMGVPNALVTFDQAWSVPTDFEGRAGLDCRSASRNVVAVEITARGFKPMHLTLPSDPMFAGNDVCLERETTSAEPPGSATVNARELSADVQRHSTALQEEGMAALKRGDNEDAEQLMRRALELTPSSSSIYNNIGISYLRRYQFDQAASWFEKAVQLSPYSPQLLGNLGMVRWLQGRQEESYQLIDRAVTGGFSTPGAHFILGVFSLRKGLVAKSVAELRKSDPERYPVRDLFLSIALHAQGKDKAASRSYETFTRSAQAPLYSALIPHTLDPSR